MPSAPPRPRSVRRSTWGRPRGVPARGPGVILERIVEQVLCVEVETAPLDGGLRRSLKQVAGRVAEELGDVDLLHRALLPRLGRTRPDAGRLPEEGPA